MNKPIVKPQSVTFPDIHVSMAIVHNQEFALARLDGLDRLAPIVLPFLAVSMATVNRL